MSLFKRASLLKRIIFLLMGTGGIGVVIVAWLNHGTGRGVVNGNVSGKVVAGERAAIQSSTNSSIAQIATNSPTPSLPGVTSGSGEPTPSQIIAGLRSARPAARPAIQKTFEGASVDWTLNLYSIYDDPHDTNGVIVLLLYKESFGPDQAAVSVFAKRSQLSELNLLPAHAKVQVRGTIFDVDETGIRLHQASFVFSK